MLDASSPGSMTESSVVLPPQAFEVCMDHFIHEQNLAHYCKVLSETTDPTKWLTALKLLADEQASHRPPLPGPTSSVILMLVRCGCGATTVAVAQKVGLTRSRFQHRHPRARCLLDKHCNG